LVAVAALAYFTPLREWLFSLRPPDLLMPDVDKTRIRELQMALIEKYERSLGDSATRLNNIVTEMERLSGTRLKQLQQKDPQLVDETPKPLPVKPNFDPRGQRVGPLYQFCVSTEQLAIEGYDRVRGFDMAGRQYVPVSRALGVNKIARPERATLNRAAIEADIGSMRDGKFEAFKKALIDADIEAKEMVAFNERLLLLAKTVMGEITTTGVIQWEVGSLEGAGRGGGGFEEGKPYVGHTLLAHEMFNVGGWGRFDAKPVFGRKIAGEGEQAEWLSIDNWWFIGPFSHPGRQNLEDLDKKYPPEDVVDLGAVYSGKSGAKIHWKYRMTRFVRIEPPPEDNDRYAIWYAYTEIYSDRDQDLWCSFGSDDYSKVWVEGKLVYASGKQVKPWAPNQDYRKVHFKNGHNRMLVKLENAGGTTGFSVVINLDPKM
jgi:hypothetical protein